MQMDATRERTPVTGVRVGLGMRVFLGFVVVLLLGNGISAALVDHQVAQTTDAQVRERLTYEVTMLGQITANALFGPIDPADTSLSGVVKQLADAVHTDLSILAPDGTVVADSDVTDLAKLEKQANAPEIVVALASGKGISVRAVGGGLRMFVAEAIVRDGKTLGLARASIPMT